MATHTLATSVRRHLGVALVVLALAVTGCSDDGDDGDAGPTTTELALSGEDAAGGTTTTAAPVEPGSAAEYETALRANLTAQAENTALVDAEQAGCVAPRWVAAITPERFGEAGVSPQALEDQQSMGAIAQVGMTIEEAGALVDVLGECGVDLRRKVLDSGSGAGVSAEALSCLDDKLTDDIVKRFAAVGLSGATEEAEAAEVSGRYLSILQDCGAYGGG